MMQMQKIRDLELRVEVSGTQFSILLKAINEQNRPVYVDIPMDIPGINEDQVIMLLRHYLRKVKKQLGIRYHVVRRGNIVYTYLYGDFTYVENDESARKVTLVWKLNDYGPVLMLQLSRIIVNDRVLAYPKY